MPSAVLVPDNQYVSAQQRTDFKFVVIFPTDEEATQNSFGFILTSPLMIQMSL